MSASGEPASTDRFTLGVFEVDPARNRLTSDGGEFALEPRVMDVLCALADEAGTVLPRRTLIDRVWKVAHGGDESLTRAISLLRKVFRAGDANTVYVKTVPRRGYVLLADVSPVTPPPPDAAPTEPPDSARRISIAVLPIESDDAASTVARAGHAFGHELTALLARSPHFRLMAYRVAPLGLGDPADPLQSAASHPPRYEVAGWIRSTEERSQLRVELLNRRTGTLVLSWLHEGVGDGFVATLDRFAERLSISIFSEIQIAEASAMHRRDNGGKVEYSQLQSAEMRRHLYSPERAAEIVDHLDQVLEDEPENAVANASLAVQLVQNLTSGWASNPHETQARALHHVTLACRAAPNDPDVLAATGIVALMTGEVCTAGRHLARAVELDPNNPHTLAVLGWQKCLHDGDRSGIDLIRTAEASAPHHPRFAHWAIYRGNGWLKRGALEQAAEAYQDSIDRNPNYFLPYLYLAASLAFLDREEEARAQVRTLLDLVPQYQLDQLERLGRRMPDIYGEWPTGQMCLEQLRRIWPRNG